MKIELVEIYKEKALNKKFIGTAHIYLIDYDIDIRGIGVFRKKNGYFCRLADRFALDPKTNEKVRYPVFRFTNPEKQQLLMQAICKEVDAYLSKEKK
jgi:hypothetical protein